MKRILLFLLCALSATAQNEVRRIDTLAQLLAINAPAVATGAKLSYVVGGRAVLGDWGSPRTATWTATVSSTNSLFTFAGIGGQWQFADANDFFIRPEWSSAYSVNNATTAILDATRLAGTNKVVLFTAPIYNVDAMTVDASMTAYMNWQGGGSLEARDNGQFGDMTVIRLRNGNTNFLTIDGNISFNVKGIMFNGNKAGQTVASPIVRVKGTVQYYSGKFQDCHFMYSKGAGFLNESRPQIYFTACSSGFNDGDGITLWNAIDNIIDNCTIGKNLGNGLTVSNFSTLRITRLDSYENLGHGVSLYSHTNTFSGWCYLKDSVMNVNGMDGLRIVGNMGLLTLDNLLFDRANADKVTGFWTNTAANGTYSFIAQYTNSGGQYPKDVSAHNLRLGFFEVGSTLKPAYHMADYTGREFKDWRLDKINFVNSGAGTPALGTVNFDFEKLKISDYVFFNTNTIPGTHAAINRLTVGTDVLNTFYPLTVVGNFMIQEKATPANQWVFDPDSTPGWILFKDGVDGNPFFALGQNGETESWSGGARKIRVNTNGFQAFGTGGAEQFSVVGSGAVVTNKLGVGTIFDPSFALTVKGPQVLKSVDGLSTHWWTITPDAGGVNGLFGISDTTDGNPTIYATSSGDVQIDSSRGFIPPRGNSASESAVSSPATSMIRYNTTLQRPRYYNGSAWTDFGLTQEEIQDSFGGGFLVAGAGISLAYNDGANTLTIANTTPGTTVAVNSANVSSPNFQNSASVTWTVVGTNITATANGATNASRVYVDASPINDPNFADSSEINFTAAGTNISGALVTGSIGLSKHANVTASRILGRDNSGVGAPQELSVVGATFSGSTLTIDAQESTNILVNSAKVTKANLKDTLSVTWTAVGSDISATAKLTDGDKGDVTVTGTGTAITIDSQAVTYSKIQNVSAASKLLGRGAGSGAGVVQEITLGTGLSMVGTTLSSTAGSGGSTYSVRDVTRRSVFNSNDETDVLTATIPANTWSADGDELTFFVPFQFLNYTGSANGFTWHLYINGVETSVGVLDTHFASSSSYKDSILEFIMKRMDVATSDGVTTLRVGNGAGGQIEADVMHGFQSKAIDFTSGIDIRLSVEMSDSQINLGVRTSGYTIKRN